MISECNRTLDFKIKTNYYNVLYKQVSYISECPSYTIVK